MAILSMALVGQASGEIYAVLWCNNIMYIAPEASAVWNILHIDAFEPPTHHATIENYTVALYMKQNSYTYGYNIELRRLPTRQIQLQGVETDDIHCKPSSTLALICTECDNERT